MNILDARKSGARFGGPSFSLANRIMRAVWNVTWALLASWTPPPLHGWRRFLITLFGGKLAAGTRVYGSAKIWFPPNLVMEEYACIGPGVNCYCMGEIQIGAHATISQRAHLCAGTHDISDPDFQLYARPIKIERNVWVAAEAFVGPGITLHEGCVLGARGVATDDLDAWTVYAGNPARALKRRVMRQ